MKRLAESQLTKEERQEEEEVVGAAAAPPAAPAGSSPLSSISGGGGWVGGAGQLPSSAVFSSSLMGQSTTASSSGGSSSNSSSSSDKIFGTFGGGFQVSSSSILANSFLATTNTSKSQQPFLSVVNSSSNGSSSNTSFISGGFGFGIGMGGLGAGMGGLGSGIGGIGGGVGAGVGVSKFNNNQIKLAFASNNSNHSNSNSNSVGGLIMGGGGGGSISNALVGFQRVDSFTNKIVETDKSSFTDNKHTKGRNSPVVEENSDGECEGEGGGDDLGDEHLNSDQAGGGGDDDDIAFVPIYNFRKADAGIALTGEEDEDCLYHSRVKLYRWTQRQEASIPENHHVIEGVVAVESTNSTSKFEWTEVGVGTIKVLRKKQQTLSTSSAPASDADNDSDLMNGGGSHGDLATGNTHNNPSSVVVRRISPSLNGSSSRSRVVMRRENAQSGVGTKLIFNAALIPNVVSVKRQNSTSIVITCVNIVEIDYEVTDITSSHIDIESINKKLGINIGNSSSCCSSGGSSDSSSSSSSSSDKSNNNAVSKKGHQLHVYAIRNKTAADSDALFEEISRCL